jgi:hypothetical protein
LYTLTNNAFLEFKFCLLTIEVLLNNFGAKFLINQKMKIFNNYLLNKKETKMKSKLLLYILPVALVSFLLFGYSIQDNPNNDMSPSLTETGRTLSLQLDTIPPVGFPYATQFNWNYSAIGGVNGGSVGALFFNGKYYMNRWNSAVLYRYNPDGPGGGPGTLADSISGYNGGAGAIRDLTVAPDGSGTQYLWGGSASTVLYKMDAQGTRLASYTHTGAAYRTIAWDPNRKGFWSSNFSDNIVCRDTTGAIKRTITNTIAGKYGMGFDSTSSPDSAFLWVWSQVTGGLQNQLDKIYLGTGLSVKTYLFNTTGASIGIAGGAEVVVKDNKLLLLLNYQNQATCGYVLKTLGGGPTPGNVTIKKSKYTVIPENGGNANPAIDTINVSGIPAGNVIRKITVKMDSVLHTWIGDLRFWVSNANTVDTVISRIGWTGSGFGNSCDNLIGTRLIDTTGVLSVQNMTPTTCNTGLPANSAGNFTPKSPLGIFNNTDPNGAYILRVCDNAAGDTGSIRSWSISIDYGPPTGVSNTAGIIEGYKLSQNYPNPFNPSTTINYTIPKTGLVTMKVFDISGREVATLINEVKTAGNYDFKFNASSLSSGVYFYRLQAGNFVETKKMFLLK